MNRRRFLTAGAAGALGATAGCSGLFEEESTSRVPAVVEDRPDAVYVPSHIEGMQMVDMQEAGDRTIALSYSFPHRFWTVEGFGFEEPTKKVELREDDSVHLMASVFDSESRTVLPTDADLSIRISRDGESVDEQRPWPMISQNMGFHFGENMQLDGDGTYTVEVEVGGVNARRLGSLEGKFEETVSAEFTLDFSQDALEEISFERLSDTAGDPGAVEPMDDMMMPLSFAPETDAMPGNPVEVGTVGDAVFVALVEETADSRELVVSPRTPHNRYSVPFMALSADVDGQAVGGSGDLSAAVHPELGYHYRGAIPEGVGADSVTVSVVTPPTVSRHEGYETAFLETGEVSADLP